MRTVSPILHLLSSSCACTIKHCHIARHAHIEIDAISFVQLSTATWSYVTELPIPKQLTMNFFVHRLRTLYLGNTFHRATDTKTDLTILLDTTYNASLVLAL